MILADYRLRVDGKREGYYEEAGIGWFDPKGRAHGSFELSINSGFKGFIAICPSGVGPPQDPMPPEFVRQREVAAESDAAGDRGEAEEDSGLN
jgi:hypothetical protein